jgi:hypothetical protein
VQYVLLNYGWQAARREHVPLQIHLDMGGDEAIAVHRNESNEIRKVLEYYVLDTPKHKEVGDFILDFTVKTTGVTEDGNQKIGKARLHLFYFPCREGHETMEDLGTDKDRINGKFQVLWQGRLLHEEKHLNSFKFMKYNARRKSGLTVPQRCFERTTGFLFLDHAFTPKTDKTCLKPDDDGLNTALLTLVDKLNAVATKQSSETGRAPAKIEGLDSAPELFEKWLEKAHSELDEEVSFLRYNSSLRGHNDVERKRCLFTTVKVKGVEYTLVPSKGLDVMVKLPAQKSEGATKAEGAQGLSKSSGKPLDKLVCAVEFYYELDGMVAGSVDAPPDGLCDYFNLDHELKRVGPVQTCVLSTLSKIPDESEKRKVANERQKQTQGCIFVASFGDPNVTLKHGTVLTLDDWLCTPLHVKIVQPPKRGQTLGAGCAQIDALFQFEYDILRDEKVVSSGTKDGTGEVVVDGLSKHFGEAGKYTLKLRASSAAAYHAKDVELKFTLLHGAPASLLACVHAGKCADHPKRHECAALHTDVMGFPLAMGELLPRIDISFVTSAGAPAQFPQGVLPKLKAECTGMTVHYSPPKLSDARTVFSLLDFQITSGDLRALKNGRVILKLSVSVPANPPRGPLGTQPAAERSARSNSGRAADSEQLECELFLAVKPGKPAHVELWCPPKPDNSTAAPNGTGEGRWVRGALPDGTTISVRQGQPLPELQFRVVDDFGNTLPAKLRAERLKGVVWSTGFTSKTRFASDSGDEGRSNEATATMSHAILCGPQMKVTADWSTGASIELKADGESGGCRSMSVTFTVEKRVLLVYRSVTAKSRSGFNDSNVKAGVADGSLALLPEKGRVQVKIEKVLTLAVCVASATHEIDVELSSTIHKSASRLPEGREPVRYDATMPLTRGVGEVALTMPDKIGDFDVTLQVKDGDVGVLERIIRCSAIAGSAAGISCDEMSSKVGLQLRMHELNDLHFRFRDRKNNVCEYPMAPPATPHFEIIAPNGVDVVDTPQLEIGKTTFSSDKKNPSFAVQLTLLGPVIQEGCKLRCRVDRRSASAESDATASQQARRRTMLPLEQDFPLDIGPGVPAEACIVGQLESHVVSVSDPYVEIALAWDIRDASGNKASLCTDGVLQASGSKRTAGKSLTARLVSDGWAGTSLRSAAVKESKLGEVLFTPFKMLTPSGDYKATFEVLDEKDVMLSKPFRICVAKSNVVESLVMVGEPYVSADNDADVLFELRTENGRPLRETSLTNSKLDLRVKHMASSSRPQKLSIVSERQVAANSLSRYVISDFAQQVKWKAGKYEISGDWKDDLRTIPVSATLEVLAGRPADFASEGSLHRMASPNENIVGDDLWKVQLVDGHKNACATPCGPMTVCLVSASGVGPAPTIAKCEVLDGSGVCGPLVTTVQVAAGTVAFKSIKLADFDGKGEYDLTLSFGEGDSSIRYQSRIDFLSVADRDAMDQAERGRMLRLSELRTRQDTLEKELKQDKASLKQQKAAVLKEDGDAAKLEDEGEDGRKNASGCTENHAHFYRASPVEETA